MRHNNGLKNASILVPGVLQMLSSELVLPIGNRIGFVWASTIEIAFSVEESVRP